VTKAKGPRLRWNQAPNVMLVTGGLLYEVGSNVMTSTPGWIWAVVGGTLATPSIYKSLRSFLGKENQE